MGDSDIGKLGGKGEIDLLPWIRTGIVTLGDQGLSIFQPKIQFRLLVSRSIRAELSDKSAFSSNSPT